MPHQLLEVLKAAAAAEGISYQTLMEKWLHERALAIAKSAAEGRPERRRRWMAEALAEYAASDVEKVWSSIDGEDFIEQ